MSEPPYRTAHERARREALVGEAIRRCLEAGYTDAYFTSAESFFRPGMRLTDYQSHTRYPNAIDIPASCVLVAVGEAMGDPPWPAVWSIADALGISCGCGNGHSMQVDLNKRSRHA